MLSPAAIFPVVMLFLLFAGPIQLQYAAKEREQGRSPGLVMEFAVSLNDVLRALSEVLQDETIHGTYVFDKELKLTGAKVAESTPLFGPWNGSGKVFYKIRAHVIAPRHFRDSADQGTIAVRYVVTSAIPERTRLQIDAVFVETTRRVVHPSDGAIESGERKAIEDHLQFIQLAEQEAADAQRRRESIELARHNLMRQRQDEATLLAAVHSSVQDLEQRVSALRHQVGQRVKPPAASLKAAPFRSAMDVATLTSYTEVVIIIVTPCWYGVETQDGHRGWLPLDQLEPLP
jgi:hypothetical protein